MPKNFCISFKSPDMQRCTKLKQFVTTGQSSHFAVTYNYIRLAPLSQGRKGFVHDTYHSEGKKLVRDM